MTTHSLTHLLYDFLWALPAAVDVSDDPFYKVEVHAARDAHSEIEQRLQAVRQRVDSCGGGDVVVVVRRAHAHTT